MATKTIERIISSITDVRAQLNNSTPSRIMSVGSNWTKIRLALRIGMTDYGSDLTSTPIFAMGFCSGTTNPFDNGSGITTNFCGLVSQGATWTRTAGPPPYYTHPANVFYMAKRQGTTLTQISANLTGAMRFYADPTSMRQCLFMDLTKGDPQYLWDCFYASGDITDIEKDEFYALASLETPARTGYTNATERYGTYDESAGALNAINIAWDRATPLFEISDAAIIRFS